LQNQDQDSESESRGEAVLEQLEADIIRREAGCHDPGPDDDRDEQPGTEELRDETSPEGGSYGGGRHVVIILTVPVTSVKIESMNSELTVEQRAARYAALAEPVRLELVDLLTLGDWSPSELQARLGLPSNLLAHHLNVLENAGIVRRGRSEADQRRSYVRLDASTLTELGVGQVVSASRVVFVCTANSARSQLAVALWNRASPVPAASGGTHPAERIDPNAIETAREHGLSIRHRRPQLLDDIRRAGDYIITVCDNAHEELGSIDALHWSIPDPVRAGNPSAFRSAFDELARRVDGLAPKMLAA
jgi:protein-tyrosine-phosphatase